MQQFTDAMRQTVSGVSVITTDGDHGRFGMTVSSVTSVSAEPPLLLVCVNRSSVAHDAIAGNQRFAVNTLAAHQQSVAASFAGSNAFGPAYEFEHGSWSMTASGLPVLTEAAAIFDCQLDTAIKAGTHTIFIGRVNEAFGSDHSPLAYSNREYTVPVGFAAANAGTKTVLEAVAPWSQTGSIQAMNGRE